jgi:hypothetical protein
MAAAALSDVMLQLFPADAPSLLEPACRAMAAFVASDMVGAQQPRAAPAHVVAPGAPG